MQCETMTFEQELKTNGYTIIPNVLTTNEIEEAKTMFKKWRETIPNHDWIHNN